jgi:hypothetical protein
MFHIKKKFSLIDRRMYLYLILIAGLVIFILLSIVLYRKYAAGFKPDNNQIIDQSSADLTMGELRKISSRPILLGLEDNLVSDEDLYFDDVNFYAINTKHNRKVVFPLTDIVELSKTSVIITNHHVWLVILQTKDNNKIVFRFTHNYTIWNKNFHVFYQKVNQISPSAVKSKWSLWTM